MSPEQIIQEEILKYEEYLEMTSEDQTAAFLLPILAHRCYASELMVDHLKRRLERYEKNGDFRGELLNENG